jgi:PAS domain-containing protein
VLSLLLRKRTVSTKAALKLLDDANAAIHYNREVLQTALDHVRQGIAVFDKDLALVCWNRQFGEIFDLPHSLTRIGATLGEILRHVAERRAATRPIWISRSPRESSDTPRKPSRSLSASPSAAW